MLLRVYVIVEEGADRIYVQQGYPAWYVKPQGRASQVLAVDIPLPFAGLIDGKVTLTPGHVAGVLTAVDE